MITARIQSLSKGFTLIELLVVIGILGILASALIATIDPFEQLKKAQDSNVKNSTVEFINANLRYFTTHNGMPWASTNEGGYLGCSGNDYNAVSVNLNSNVDGGTTCVDALISDGELKSGYDTATNVIKEIYFSGSTNTVTACFKPQSKAQQRDVNTVYGIDGTVTTATCKSKGGTADCYWCAVL